MVLNNSQYNKILREYDKRRIQNKHDLDMRSKEAYKAIPMLKDIDNELIESSVKYAKLMLSGEKDDVSALKENNLILSMKKIELLLANGFPGNYLEPSYQCEDCKDTGYIENEKCHCFKQAMVDLVYSQSNLKNILIKENFSTFSFDYYSDSYMEEATRLTPLQNIQKVVAACKEFIENFDSGYNNILLYGNTGVGKTFLANCIAKELLDTAHTVIYLTAFQLFDILEKNAFHKNTGNIEIENQFNYIFNCDLLIIDDLGAEINSSVTISQLYLCINERHLRQKSTLISTNLSWENLHSNYNERIFSRITSNYLLLKIVGDDIRLKKVFS